MLMGEMANADAELAGLYRQCSARLGSLIDWVNEAMEKLTRKGLQ